MLFRSEFKNLGLSQKTYYDALNIILKKTFKNFPNSKFGVALVSRCSNNDMWHPIREAQLRVIEDNKNTFLSSDSDQIKQRYDNCHFSDKGASRIGKEYYYSIKSFMNLDKE